jgi:hypothetical protein
VLAFGWPLESDWELPHKSANVLYNLTVGKEEGGVGFGSFRNHRFESACFAESRFFGSSARSLSKKKALRKAFPIENSKLPLVKEFISVVIG